MKRYGRHVSRIRNLKHPLTVYPAMGWPPSRVRGQTRRQRACNGVFKRSRSLKSRFFLWNLCLFSQRKILPSFFLRYAFLIRSKFFLFFFLFFHLEIVTHRSVLFVLFQEEQFDVGEIPSANLEDRTVPGEVEVRGPIVARNRDEAYSSRR